VIALCDTCHGEGVHVGCVGETPDGEAGDGCEDCYGLGLCPACGGEGVVRNGDDALDSATRYDDARDAELEDARDRARLGARESVLREWDDEAARLGGERRGWAW
jgi:hypothetical protein